MREKDPALVAFRNWLRGEAELQRRVHERLGLT
jgi:LysR family glycine cleavage system transcriptional activator/LysR family transcriptional regulator of beta-lactamase